jgi:ribonuclease HI
MTGRYRINAPTIVPLAARAKELQRKFLKVDFEHVRRELNKTADQLANLGADESEKMRKHA